MPTVNLFFCCYFSYCCHFNKWKQIPITSSEMASLLCAQNPVKENKSHERVFPCFLLFTLSHHLPFLPHFHIHSLHSIQTVLVSCLLLFIVLLNSYSTHLYLLPTFPIFSLLIHVNNHNTDYPVLSLLLFASLFMPNSSLNKLLCWVDSM